MPEHYRALVVVILIGGVSYYLLSPLSNRLGRAKELYELYKYWLILTTFAFVCGNYWLFIGISFIVLFLGPKRDVSFQVALYFFLLLSLPELSKKIPGFGGVNYIFTLSWPIFLGLCLLVPLFPRFDKYNKKFTVKSSIFNALVVIFVLYIGVLSFRDTSITNGFRNVLEFSLQALIPYWVVSHSVRNVDDIQKVLHAVYAVIFFMSLIGIFGSLKHWHLYSSLTQILEERAFSIDQYKERAGILRASAVYGNIHLGTMVGVAIGVGIYLHRQAKSKYLHVIHGLILLSALILTFSRGPWVGVGLMLSTYVLLSRNSTYLTAAIVILMVIIMPLLNYTKVGNNILSLLPFIGDADISTVSYRQLLFSISVEQINENPLFGSTDYYDSPRMQQLIQGEGIIDIVNTYLQIGLGFGYFGILLFSSIIVGIPARIYFLGNRLRKYRLLELGKVRNMLVPVYLLLIVVVATVSTLGNEQVTSFIFAISGVGVGFIRIYLIEKMEIRNLNI